MSGFETSMLNDAFLKMLDSGDGKEKLGAAGNRFIRDRLREECVVDKILPPEPVTPADCQISEHHDTLVKIEFVEPQSQAMTVTFRGQPRARYIQAPRMAIPFYTISSEKLQKTEQELMVYGSMPITKILEDNMVKDMQEIKDRETLRHFEASVQALQVEANAGAVALHTSTYNAVVKSSVIKSQNALAQPTDNFTVFPILRPDLPALFNLLDNNRLSTEILLMSQFDYNNLLTWTLQDLGDKVTSETAVDGWTYSTLLGKKFIRSIKNDVFRPGNVWAFTKPDFFGRSYILNNTKFYIDKIARDIFWQSWMDVAVGIVNIASVRKLELYSGSVTPGATDAGFEARLPLDEDALGAMNNRVDAGLKFPNIVATF